MGLYRRLFQGASSRKEDAPRSPEDARAVSDLSEELRALKKEIKKLREALDTDTEPLERKRGRRGGRNRSGKDSRDDERSKGGSFSQRGRRDGAPKAPPEDAPTGLLVDYLKRQKVLVFEGQDDLGQNEAFEHLARHIGQHFELLAPFYEKMKRAVATGKTTRIDIDSYSEQERSAAVQLGTLLYRHGMLKDFYYHRSPKRQLRVIPNKDGEIQQFLTGGWLEIYVVWMLSRRLRARMSPAKYQVLFNVKGTLPDEREFEADLMACIDGRLLWLECKTGQWQDYSARFRGLVKTFGTDREGAGLVLIKPPDGSTRGRATDMLDMTLLSLAEVGDFVDDFLGVPIEERTEDEPRARGRGQRGGRGRDEAAKDTSSKRSGGRSSQKDDRTAPLPLGEVPPRSEDEVPLENPEPAKKLGKVELEGEEEVPRRRRRRRRGGRGRGGSGASPDDGSTEAKDEPAPAKRGRLREELPVQPFGAEKDDAPEEPELTDSAESAAGARDEAAVSGEAEDQQRRRRGSRGGRRRRRKDEDGPDEESAAETRPEKADQARPEPPPAEKPVTSEPAAAASQASKPKSAAKKAADQAPAIPEGMMVARPKGLPAAAAPTPSSAAPAEEVRVPREERSSSVIAPDLSAMLAGGAKKAASETEAEAPEEEPAESS